MTSRQSDLGAFRRVAASLLVAAGLLFSGVAAARISEEQAVQAALKALPGKVTDTTIEKKRGKTVYVVEIVSEKDGTETDVLIDPETGQLIGMDK